LKIAKLIEQNHDLQRMTKGRKMLTSKWNAKEEIENEQESRKHFFVGGCTPVDLRREKEQNQGGGGNQRLVLV
jgi:hypothetical protein